MAKRHNIPYPPGHRKHRPVPARPIAGAHGGGAGSNLFFLAVLAVPIAVLYYGGRGIVRAVRGK